MGGEACAEGSEPDLTGVGVGGDRFLQGGENARAADVSVITQDGAGFVEWMRGEAVFDGEDDIASTGMGNEASGVADFF